MEKAIFNKDTPRDSFSNERQEIIQKFTDRLNTDRIGTKYPPLKWNVVNGKLSFINSKTYPYPEGELWKFYRMCEEYKGNFSKCFFGALKRK